MSRLLRLVRAVSYTPARQLLGRCKLIVKRHCWVAAVACWPSLAERKHRPAPSPASDPPMPLWPASRATHVFRASNGNWTFDFLNRTLELDSPVRWHHPILATGTRLWKLHLHYFDWAGKLADGDFIELTEDWIAHNRPYKEGYWLDSWNSYAISIRVVAWMGELALRAQRLPADFVSRLEQSIQEQVHFLHSNLELDIGGNHVVKNIKALLWAARYFDGAESAVWRARGAAMLAVEMKRQILPDGFHFERSPAYHIQVLTDLLDAWRLLPAGPLQDRLGQTLDSMLQAAVDMSHPDGSVALFNDGGLNMTYELSVVIDAFEQTLGKPAPAQRATAHLADAGYQVMHSAAITFLHDAGAVGPDGLPAHAHGDIHSFELSVGGLRFVVDAGVYEYNSGTRRELSRSTLMHNTVTLDDRDQCEFWGAFRMGRRARVRVNDVRAEPARLLVDAEHDGYSHLPGAPLHRRIVEALPSGRVQIRDRVMGGIGQVVRARLLLHPEVTVEEQGAGNWRLSRRAAALDLTCGQLLSVRVEPSVWWPDFGVELKTSVIVMEMGAAPVDCTFSLTVPTNSSVQLPHAKTPGHA